MKRTPFARTLNAACAAAALTFAGSALAQDAGCPAGLSRLETRLLAQAADGPDALRRFVNIRRAILLLDVGDTLAWAEAVRAANPACMASHTIVTDMQPADVALSDPPAR